MSAQTTEHSPEFQVIISQVEAALNQAAADARELAERTGTPLVVRDSQCAAKQKADSNSHPA